MIPPSRQQLVLVTLVCAAAGLYGWAVFLSTFSHDGSIGPRYNAPGTDWMVFYAAARAYLDGNLPLIFDGDRFTAYLNESFAGWLSEKMPFHPWLYPPHYLLLLLPFGLLPFPLSYAAFMATTFVALGAAIWRYAEDSRRKWLLSVSLLIAPATSLNVITGQNAFLTGALFVGGFGLLRDNPMLAGALLGMLTFKPTLALLVPVALIAGRHWRALASAATTVLVLAAASLAVFGAEPWRLWIEMAIVPPEDFYRNWLEWGRLWGDSIYACAMLLGASHTAANAAQAAATLSAAGIVYWTYRRPLPADRQLTVLLAATILAAPHVLSYDTVLLAIAASLFFCAALEDDLRLLHVTAMLAVWLVPPLIVPRVNPLGLAVPLFICLFIWSALATTSARAPLGLIRPA
jgi:alpha-1,2-mannosyltransferase